MKRISEKGDGQNQGIDLIDDPLTTTDTSFLERILEAAKDYRFMVAVQMAPFWRNTGVLTDSSDKPLNTYLPGGWIIRARYLVQDIRDHYENLLMQQT